MTILIYNVMSGASLLSKPSIDLVTERERERTHSQWLAVISYRFTCTGTPDGI